MEKTKIKAKKMLIAALILCLVSMVGAGLVQTSGGSVTVKDLRWETELGRTMSALLFIPDTATPENPAPAIITSHGWYNNREMQDLNYVEYARRGYVVMSIDMYGHGHSEPFTGAAGYAANATGMYDAVELVAALPYVDTSKIGVTGHSNGARAANLAVQQDNRENPGNWLISALLLVANDATYRTTVDGVSTYENIYGNRDVGIIAALYDEFFFRGALMDGSGNSVPRTYLDTVNAQSFLNFGRDPTTDNLPLRENSTYYTENIDDRTASRVIYQPNQIHPWNHFSKTAAAMGIEFFNNAFGAPNPIEPESQIWQLKAFFNCLGLIGFVTFIINFAILMLFTPLFSSLRADKLVEARPAPSGQGLGWFWGGLVASAAFSGLIYFKALDWARGDNQPSFFLQQPPFGVGFWAMLCGLFAILIMVLFYNIFGKKDGLTLADRGVPISLKRLGHTILLALLTVAAAFSLVFIADYFFKTDFRLWVLAVKAFTPDKLIIALPYLVLFMVYYVANSVSVNCFNYVKNGKSEWLNISLLAFFNALGPLVIVLLQYIHFRATGNLLFRTRPEGEGLSFPMGAIGGIWLFPMLVILPMAAIISRKLYKVSMNPYLPGIINAAVVVIISCTNTLTILPEIVS